MIPARAHALTEPHRHRAAGVHGRKVLPEGSVEGVLQVALVEVLAIGVLESHYRLAETARSIVAPGRSSDIPHHTYRPAGTASAFGSSTASITWITPFDATMSAVTTCAPFTYTFPPRTTMSTA